MSDEKESLAVRARRVSEQLREGTARLKEVLGEVENRLRAQPTTPAMIKLPKSGKHLSWDGEHFWVIDRRSKIKLLDCERSFWIEASHCLAELGEKVGATFIKPLKNS